MKTTLILNANIVNEGQVFTGDVLIRGQYIENIGKNLSGQKADQVIDAKGKYLLPGVIDDQVHFREPGLTHKANDLYGGEGLVWPVVLPVLWKCRTPILRHLLRNFLNRNFRLPRTTSLANHSFFIGASNDNVDEVMKTDITRVCGLKIFMGSSTGNLLVDDPAKLEAFFSRFPSLIAAHCEDEQTIRANTAAYKEKYGDDVPVECHPLIRSAEACYKSSSFADRISEETRNALSHSSYLDRKRNRPFSTTLFHWKKEDHSGSLCASFVVQRFILQRERKFHQVESGN